MVFIGPPCIANKMTVKPHCDTAFCFCDRCDCGVLPPTTAAEGDKTDDDATAGCLTDTGRLSFLDSAPPFFNFRGLTGGGGFLTLFSVDTRQ